MARKKKNPDAEKLAESILNTYQPESVEDMQDVLKDVFGPLFEKMLQGELNNNLGMTPILKSQRNMTIDETVMAIRRLKRALVK